MCSPDSDAVWTNGLRMQGARISFLGSILAPQRPPRRLPDSSNTTVQEVHIIHVSELSRITQGMLKCSVPYIKILHSGINLSKPSGYYTYRQTSQ